MRPNYLLQTGPMDWLYDLMNNQDCDSSTLSFCRQKSFGRYKLDKNIWTRLQFHRTSGTFYFFCGTIPLVWSRKELQTTNYTSFDFVQNIFWTIFSESLSILLKKSRNICFSAFSTFKRHLSFLHLTKWVF